MADPFQECRGCAPQGRGGVKGRGVRRAQTLLSAVTSSPASSPSSRSRAWQALRTAPISTGVACCLARWLQGRQARRASYRAGGRSVRGPAEVRRRQLEAPSQTQHKRRSVGPSLFLRVFCRAACANPTPIYQPARPARSAMQLPPPMPCSACPPPCTASPPSRPPEQVELVPLLRRAVLAPARKGQPLARWHLGTQQHPALEHVVWDLQAEGATSRVFFLPPLSFLTPEQAWLRLHRVQQAVGAPARRAGYSICGQQEPCQSTANFQRGMQPGASAQRQYAAPKQPCA